MNKIKSFQIDKSRLREMPIGCIAGNQEDYLYKNTVIGYINGDIPIFIKTNLNQRQWNRFCDGKLSEEELHKYI